MDNIINKYPLTAQSVDTISQAVYDICKSNKADSKTIRRYQLSAEESMLKWLETNAEPEASFYFESGKRLFRPYFKISADTKELNPYVADRANDFFGTAENTILMNIGLIPEYSYQNGKNSLLFKIKKKSANSLLVLVGVILVSVIIGLIGKLLLPADLISIVSESFITPVEDAFFRMLSAIAGPMIFLSVAWGVYGIGDVYTFGKIGKKMMLEFLKVIFLFCILASFFYPLLGPKISNEVSLNNRFSEIFEMLLSIIPSDIVSPFTQGNTLQIIMLAFILGFSMIFLGQRTSAVARAVEQINNIIQLLMGFVSKLVPYFVFIVLVNIIWSSNLSTFSNVWQFALIFLVVCFLLSGLFLLYVSLTCKTNPVYLFKSILPAYLLALSTASSSAAFESTVSVSNNKLGIKNELTAFGVPFGMVMFKPTSAVYYLLLSFYFANIYSTNVSYSWIITAIIISAISAIATPPIPGGASVTYTVLFLQLGIPSEAIVPALAVDMVFDFILTSSDINMLLLNLLRISKKTGMRKKLEIFS